jgi:hypothetical protein
VIESFQLRNTIFWHMLNKAVLKLSMCAGPYKQAERQTGNIINRKSDEQTNGWQIGRAGRHSSRLTD